MNDVWNKVTQWMQKEFKYTETPGSKMVLKFKGKEMEKTTQSLTEVGLQNNSKLDVFIEEPQAKQETKVVEEPAKEIIKSRESYAPKELLPKPPKSPLMMEPDYSEMCRMTTEELKAVKDLKLWNEHGRVEFIGPTDVTNVDFDDVVSIKKSSVEVYDE